MYFILSGANKENLVTVFIFFMGAICLQCNGSADLEPDKGIEITGGEITAVSISGDESNYQFSVTIRSPDTGCSQYADWWEVISPRGDLIYRRILTHSHVDEQPFTRSGGPVQISGQDSVIIRVHMNNLGYGLKGQSGTVSGGFISVKLDPEFAPNLSKQAPLPDGCRF